MNDKIPIFLIVLGILILLRVLFWSIWTRIYIFFDYYHYDGHREMRNPFTVTVSMVLLLSTFAWSIIGMYWVFGEMPVYIKGSEQYCHMGLYGFAAFGAVSMLAFTFGFFLISCCLQRLGCKVKKSQTREARVLICDNLNFSS